MGWTGTHKPSGQSLFDFFSQEFNGEHHKVIDVATEYQNPNVAYMALKIFNGKVLGVVILIHRGGGYYNFTYKEVSEDMGPYATKCPERILRQLSPLSKLFPGGSMYAATWRVRCWRRIARIKALPKLLDGVTIKTAAPIRFTDGSSRDTFLISVDRHSIRCWDGWQQCRISRKRLQEIGYAIVKGDDQE